MSNHSKLKSFISNKQVIFTLLFFAVGYALFKRSFREIGDIFLGGLLLLSIISLYVERKQLIRDKIVFSFLTMLAVLIISSSSQLFDSDALTADTKDISFVFNLFLFFFVAYALKGKLKNVYYFWGAYCIGIILLIAFSSSNIIAELQQGLAGKRVDFNVVNAQHPAMMAGVALLISLFYFYKALYVVIYKEKTLKTTLFLLGLLASVACFLLLIVITQTRQVWLSLLVAIFSSQLLYILMNKHKINKKFMLLSNAITIITVIALSQSSIIKNRVGAESQTLKHLEQGIIETVKQGASHGYLDNIGYSSIGTRINLWIESIPWIVESPIVGSGYATVAKVIIESERLPEQVTAKFTHLHNSHIEVLVSYGVIGFVTLAFCYYWLIKTSSVASKAGSFNEIQFLAILFVIYWLLVNMFESFYFARSGQFVHSIMFAGVYTFYLNRNLHNKLNN